MAPDFGLTLKLTNLPYGTKELDIRRHLREYPDMKDKYIKGVSEPCLYSSLTPDRLGALVTLKSVDIARKLYSKISETPKQFLAEEGGHSMLDIDNDFLDLTTVYTSTKGPNGQPTVE